MFEPRVDWSAILCVGLAAVLVAVVVAVGVAGLIAWARAGRLRERVEALEARVRRLEEGEPRPSDAGSTAIRP